MTRRIRLICHLDPGGRLLPQRVCEVNENKVPLDSQYTHANICADGGLLCRTCALTESDCLAKVDPKCPDDDQWRIIGTTLVETHARCDNCGHLIRTPVSVGCDSCAVSTINGVACHETGCPRSHIDPCTGDPYPIPCFECGCDFVPDTHDCLGRHAVCPDCSVPF